MNPNLSRISGATAWTADSIGLQAYSHELQPAHTAALHAVCTELATKGLELATVQRRHFDRPEFRDLASIVLSTLFYGPGIVILRGWPVLELSEADAGLLYWGLASILGVPQPQNLRGDRLHAVATTPVSDPGTTAPGGSTGDNEIILHTENARPPIPPKILGLLCLRPADTGGESVFMSGHTVHNWFTDYRPELLSRLYEAFQFGRHDEVYPDGRRTDSSPVFLRDGNQVAVRYGRYWLRVAEKESDVRLDEAGRKALDQFDEVLERPEFTLTTRLSAGDVVFVDNRVVLHGRREFSDAGSTQQTRRRLLRVWIG